MGYKLELERVELEFAGETWHQLSINLLQVDDEGGEIYVDCAVIDKNDILWLLEGA